MADTVQRLLTAEHIQEVVGATALPGTPVYAKLAGVDQSLLDAAADIGAMQAARVSQNEINQARDTLMGGVQDVDVRGFLGKVVSASEKEAQLVINEGGTIGTIGGRILWNSEQKLPDELLRSLEKSGHTLSGKELGQLTELYNAARVDGALSAAGEKVSKTEITNAAQDLLKENRTAGDKAAGAVRKTARVGGTIAGGLVATPFAVVGGAGGAVVGAVGKVLHHRQNKQTRGALTTAQQSIAANATAENATAVRDAITGIHGDRRAVGKEISKGVKWGVGLGTAGAAGGAFAGNRLANWVTGGKGAKADREIKMLVLEAGLREGIASQGGIVVEDPAREEKGVEEARKLSREAYTQEGSKAAVYELGNNSAYNAMSLQDKIAAVGKGASIEEAFNPGQLKIVDIDRSSLPQGRQNDAVAILPEGMKPEQLDQQLKIMQKYAPDADVKLVQVKDSEGKDQYAFLGVTGAQASAFSAYAAAVGDKGRAAPSQEVTTAKLELGNPSHDKALAEIKESIQGTGTNHPASGQGQGNAASNSGKGINVNVNFPTSAPQTPSVPQSQTPVPSRG